MRLSHRLVMEETITNYLKAFAENDITDEEFAAERSQYSHARPFTKESLLYREIFDTIFNLKSFTSN